MTFIKTHKSKLLILLISVIALFIAFTPALDIQAKSIIDKAFTQALIVFASAKALNAAISIAQGSELNLFFATIAVGQFLDPLNDLVEQFSLIMLASLVSLGIQKILMGFVANSSFNLLLAFNLIVLNLLLFIRFKNDDKFRLLFFKLTVVLVFLRFAVPLMAYANNAIYEYSIKPQYNIEQLNGNVEDAKEKVNKMTNDAIEQKEEKSFMSSIKEKFISSEVDDEVTNNTIKQKEEEKSIFSKLKEKFTEKDIEKTTDDSSVYIVDLIIVFIFQTILLPLVFLIMIYFCVKSIFTFRRER